MKRSKIMALEGEALAHAVAESHGWFLDKDGYPGWFKRPDHPELFKPGSLEFLVDFDAYRPDRNLIQAFFLVQKLWDGMHPRQANGKDPVVSCVNILLTDSIPQMVEITVYSPTLADVFVDGEDLCTTICRAYLMVVIGEE